jgi:3-oxoacyl-[acyl-carrier-protein] synthase II
MKTERDNIAVLGAGWMTGGRHGCVRLGGSGAGDDPFALVRRTELFETPPKNFARFDIPSRVTCCACALTLRDAGLSPAADASAVVGMVATNESGCTETNQAYFLDYVQAGRTLARGNLFIYTLPTSPLAEAAIHFGLRGPSLYWGGPAGRGYGAALAEAVERAAACVAAGEAAAMLAVSADARGGLGLALGPAAGAGPFLAAASALALLAPSPSLAAAVEALSRGFNGGSC